MYGHIKFTKCISVALLARLNLLTRLPRSIYEAFMDAIIFVVPTIFFNIRPNHREIVTLSRI